MADMVAGAKTLSFAEPLGLASLGFGRMTAAVGFFSERPAAKVRFENRITA
jgi:hypothetical protein